MTISFNDYDGPTGMYVATGTQILDLTSVAGMIAATGGAVQAGIGDPVAAEKLQTDVDAVVAKALGQ